MSEQQLQLLPSLDERPIGVEIDLDLTGLPSNATLVGPDPRPEFIELVRRYGVMQRIIVNTTSRPGTIPPKLQVLWRRRRIKAARALGLKSIPALLYNLPPAQAHAILIADHGTRKENPAADLASIRFLLDKGAKEEEIAAATGLGIGVVRRRLKLNALIPPFDKAFLKGKLTVAVAEALAKLSNETQTRLHVKYESEGRLTLADVAEERRAAVRESAAELPFADIAATPAHEDDDERLGASRYAAAHLTRDDLERIGAALMVYKESRHNYSDAETDAIERLEVDALAAKLNIPCDYFQPEVQASNA